MEAEGAKSWQVVPCRGGAWTHALRRAKNLCDTGKRDTNLEARLTCSIVLAVGGCDGDLRGADSMRGAGLVL